MAYSRRGFIPTILLIGTALVYWQYTQYIICVALLFLAVKLGYKGFVYAQTHLHHYALKDIDTMDGLCFERYVASILRKRGYRNVLLTERYDYGVDIIAEKNGVRWGIQVKRYTGLVKADAVRQVVAGLQLYGCDRAMVITNSVFSTVAKQLAEGNDCVLIDRTALARLL